MIREASFVGCGWRGHGARQLTVGGRAASAIEFPSALLCTLDACFVPCLTEGNCTMHARSDRRRKCLQRERRIPNAKASC